VPTDFDPRAFVRVDVGYDEHPKIAPLSDAAFRAHVEAMTWCGRNPKQNGRINKRVAAKKWRAKVVAELVAAGLLEDEEDHWSLHDYLDFNRSSEEIEASRESRGVAGTLGNHKRWHVARRAWSKDCEYCIEGGRIAIAN